MARQRRKIAHAVHAPSYLALMARPVRGVLHVLDVLDEDAAAWLWLWLSLWFRP